MALQFGLEAALARGATAIDVRMDSELVVRQLTGVYRVKNAQLQPLHAKASRLYAQFSERRIGHVPRKQNVLADTVVNRVLDSEQAARVRE